METASEMKTPTAAIDANERCAVTADKPANIAAIVFATTVSNGAADAMTRPAEAV